MARIRTIKPEFWKNEALSELPEATHLLAAALLNYADDYGYFNANPRLIESECSPLREPSVSVPESLQSLHAIGYLKLGVATDEKHYGLIVGFTDHQRVSHPSESKIAKKSIAWDVSTNPPENSGDAHEPLRLELGTGNGMEGISSEPKNGRKNYPQAFEAFWKDYPTDPLMSKSKAYEKWARLSEEDRRNAHAAVPAFRAHCTKDPTYRPIHAERFISQRRFDGFLEKAASDASPGSKSVHPSWNGHEAPLRAAIGNPNFEAYFAEFPIEGDIFYAPTDLRKQLIEKKFSSHLHVLGITVEVRA